MRNKMLTNGARAWPCINAPWPREAYGSDRPPARLYIYATDSRVCIVGAGWANRAESTAMLLMRGVLAVHQRLAMRAPRPSSFRLHDFERVVTISLLDSYVPPWRKSPHVNELAYSCKGDQPHGCGVGLVPHFIFENYHEAGPGDFTDMVQELTISGSKPARTRMCGWAGANAGHECLALVVALTPLLFFCKRQSQQSLAPRAVRSAGVLNSTCHEYLASQPPSSLTPTCFLVICRQPTPRGYSRTRALASSCRCARR